jgi:hypothetical protein
LERRTEHLWWFVEDTLVSFEWEDDEWLSKGRASTIYMLEILLTVSRKNEVVWEVCVNEV